MLKLKLTRKGPRPSKASVKAIEEMAGGKLPADFRSFIEAYNSGTATGYYFQRNRRNCYLNTILSTRVSPRTEGPISILEVKTNCEDFIPSDAIPIAFVNGSDLLLLRTKARRFGAIDLKIDANAGMDDNPEAGVVKISKNLGDFLRRLKYTPSSQLDDDEYGLW